MELSGHILHRGQAAGLVTTQGNETTIPDVEIDVRSNFEEEPKRVAFSATAKPIKNFLRTVRASILTLPQRLSRYISRRDET